MARIGFFAASLVLFVHFVGCGASQSPDPQTMPDADGPDLRAAQAKHDRAFAARAALLRESCGITAELRIDWPTIDAAALKQHDVSARCGVLLESMSKLCAANLAPQPFTMIEQISCGFDNENSLVLEAKTLDALIAPGQADLAGALELRLKNLKEGPGPSLATAKVDVCYKDEEHVILLFPQGTEHHGLSYGDGSSFFYLGQPKRLSVGWFFEPRYPSKRRVFRGYNLEVYSKVSVDHEKKTCTLRCGDRAIPLSLASHEQGAKILAGATFQPSPHQREVHALARDMRGIYYLVDRGTTKATRADFRVYIGRRAKLKLQDMKDIAADSEGEIFSTKEGKYKLVFGKGKVYSGRRETLTPQEIKDAVVDSDGQLFLTRGGKLYLVFGEGQSAWIVNGKKHKLTVLPVEENLPMIYNELGVYPRHKLGTPCDDI